MQPDLEAGPEAAKGQKSDQCGEILSRFFRDSESESLGSPNRARVEALGFTRERMFPRDAEGRALPVPEPRRSRDAISEAVELDVSVFLSIATVSDSSVKVSLTFTKRALLVAHYTTMEVELSTYVR